MHNTVCYWILSKLMVDFFGTNLSRFRVYFRTGFNTGYLTGGYYSVTKTDDGHIILFQQSYYAIMASLYITSKRCHFDVITSKWRRFDVITTLLLRHVFIGMGHNHRSYPQLLKFALNLYVMIFPEHTDMYGIHVIHRRRHVAGFDSLSSKTRVYPFK